MSVQIQIFSVPSVIIDSLICYDETGKSEMQNSILFINELIYLFKELSL